MRNSILFVSLLFVLLPFALNAQEKQDNWPNTKVSVQVKNGKLIDLFDQISALTGIYFSYDPSLVDTDQPISIEAKNQTIDQVLKAVFSERFSFQLLKNQLIITVNQQEDGSGHSAVTFKSVFKLSGKLTDRQTHQSIPYASISVSGHPFGTISNGDGEFRITIPNEYKSEDLVFSCLGYSQHLISLDTLMQNELDIQLSPINVQLKEVKVTAIDPLDVMDQLVENIETNYSNSQQLMTSFYREVLKQNDDYINVSEAVMDILKSSYGNTFRQDNIRYLKGRKTKEARPSVLMVDFKMQGGPYYITKLDVVKTRDSFIDPEFREYYKYKVDRVILYRGRPTVVIQFEPDGRFDYLTYEGELYVDRESYALVYAAFSLSRNGKKVARKSLIRKKPRGFNVRPIELNYTVSYKNHNDRWYFNAAQASVKFHVKSRRDKINSVFHSISDLLVTDYRETNLKRFSRHENFNSSEIFSELIADYDEDFWGDYNIIKPTEDLRKALKKEAAKESSFHTNQPTNQLTLQKSIP